MKRQLCLVMLIAPRLRTAASLLTRHPVIANAGTTGQSTSLRSAHAHQQATTGTGSAGTKAFGVAWGGQSTSPGGLMTRQLGSGSGSLLSRPKRRQMAINCCAYQSVQKLYVASGDAWPCTANRDAIRRLCQSSRPLHQQRAWRMQGFDESTRVPVYQSTSHRTELALVPWYLAAWPWMETRVIAHFIKLEGMVHNGAPTVSSRCYG